MTRVIGTARTRKQLVPGREAGPLAIDRHPQVARIPAGEPATRVPQHEIGLLLVERGGYGPVDVGRITQDGREHLKVARVGSGGPLHRIVNQHRANFEVDGDVLTRVDTAAQIVPPCSVWIDECLDGVPIASRDRDLERRPPAIVAERRHGRLTPRGFLVAAEEQQTGELVVSVGKNVGLDDDLIAGGALDGKPPGVNLGRYPFDRHALASVGVGTWQHGTSFRLVDCADGQGRSRRNGESDPAPTSGFPAMMTHGDAAGGLIGGGRSRSPVRSVGSSACATAVTAW